MCLFICAIQTQVSICAVESKSNDPLNRAERSAAPPLHCEDIKRNHALHRHYLVHYVHHRTGTTLFSHRVSATPTHFCIWFGMPSNNGIIIAMWRKIPRQRHLPCTGKTGSQRKGQRNCLIWSSISISFHPARLLPKVIKSIFVGRACIRLCVCVCACV